MQRLPEKSERARKSKITVGFTANRVVVLQPTLVKPQRFDKVAGREIGYITPTRCLSPLPGRGFFLEEGRIECPH